MRVSFRGQPVHDGAARVGKAHRLGDLVVGLAGGVVARSSKEEILSEALHQDYLRVPPGHNHAQKGRGEVGV